MKKIILVIILLGMIGAGGAAFYFFKQSQKQVFTAQEHFDHAKTFEENKEYDKAYRNYIKAAELEPKTLEFQKEAATFAGKVNMKAKAVYHAKKAWKLGAKELTILNLLLNESSLKPEDRLEKGLEYLEEIENPDPTLSLKFKVGLHLNANKIDEGIALVKKHWEAQQSSGILEFYAQVLMQARRYEEAKDLLLTHRGTSLYKRTSALLLNGCYHRMLQPIMAHEVLEKATLKYPDDQVIGERHALNLLGIGRVEKALNAFTKIYQGVSGSEEGEKNLKSAYRINLAFIYLVKNQVESFDQLVQEFPKDTKIGEAEGYLYEGIKLLIESKPGAIEKLEKANRLYQHPLVVYFYNEALYKAGKYKEAMDSAMELVKSPDFSIGIYAWSPYFTMQRALILTQMNERVSALQHLQSMFQRNVATKEALQLFRELSLKENRADMSWKAQQLLEDNLKDDPGTMWESASLALRTQNFERAESHLKRLAKKMPDAEPIEIGEILILLGKKKYEEALKRIDSSKLKKENKDLLKANALRGMGKVDEAISLLEELLKGEDRPNVNVELGRLYFLQGDFSKAEEQFLKVKRVSKRDIFALKGLIDVSLSTQNYKSSTDYVNEALSIEPNNSDVLWLAAKNAMHINKPREALVHIERVNQMHDEFVPGHLLKAFAYFRLKEFEEAERVYRRVLQKNDQEKEAIFKLAEIYAIKKEYRRSLSLINKYPDLQKEDISLATIKFRVMAQLKKYAEAEKWLRAHMKLKEMPMNLELAWLDELQGKYLEARDRISKYDNRAAIVYWSFLSLKAKQPSKVLEKIHSVEATAADCFTLAIEAGKIKESALSGQLFKLALEKKPDNVTLHNNYAWMVVEGGLDDRGGALKSAQYALDKKPGNIEILDTYAYVFNHFKEYEKLAEALYKNSKLIEVRPKLVYLLAKAQKEINQHQRALESYNELIRLQEVRGEWVVKTPKEQVLNEITVLSQLIEKQKN